VRRAAAPRTRPQPRRPRAATTRPDTRTAIFSAAAELFAARGFDGTGVDDIAHAARVNKAMIYYHFDSKLALYRDIVRDTLRTVGTMVAGLAGADTPPDRQIDAFVAGMVALTDQRSWAPPLMLREIAEGAPRLDPETLALMKGVFMGFRAILDEGRRTGTFRAIHPVLAYMSVIAPILLNAARERAARRPGRIDLPLFAEVPHAELTVHMQQAALRLLAREP
jgi:AcrR family transcriptional regulator